MKKVVALVLVLLFMLTCFSGFWLQTIRREFIPYSHHIELDDTINPSLTDLPLKKIPLKTVDNINLVAYSAVQLQPKGWIILVHGYTPNGWKSLIGLGEFFFDEGYNILIPSLRSFGESEGQKVYLGTREWQDVAAAHEYVRTQNPATLPVGWYGVSMGAASSIVAAGKTTPPDFLMTMVPFATPLSYFEKQLSDEPRQQQLARPFLSLLLPSQLGPDLAENNAAAQIQDITIPLLIIAGARDNQVKYADSQLLYQMAGTPSEHKQLLTIDGGHDLFAEQPDTVRSMLRNFLKTATPATSQ